MAEMSWDKEAEIQQARWRKKNRVLLGINGNQNGVTREWILPSDKWLSGTWDDAHLQDLLINYLEAGQIQAHQGRHNLKSSWTQCANLFFPFRYDYDMKRMLVSFLKRELNLNVSTINALELEYAAPGKLAPEHLLGESSGKRGSGQTSPDVAILFSCDDDKCGIYLIENKYTEHHFYACSAAKKTLGVEYGLRGLKPNPAPERCKDMKELLSDFSRNCHQASWGRRYWTILADSVDTNRLLGLPYCPAMKDGYQLMRQQALAQGIADSGLFNYVISGVAYDERNRKLVECLSALGLSDFTRGWQTLFDGSSKVKFHCFSHQKLVSWVMRSRSDYIQKWGKYICERYGYQQKEGSHATG